MRKNSLLLLTMVLTVFLAGSVWAADVTLQIDPATLFTGTTGNTVELLMDNTGVDIAANQVDILFDKDCFTVTAVAKTSRTTAMDIFNFSQIAGGIRIALTGIGHKIDPGAGPIANISVDVAEGCVPGDYVWDITGCVVADPMGVAQNCIQIDNAITVSVPVCIPELNATTFNLGNVRLNGVGTAALTVKNVGTAAGAVTITGATAAPASFNLAVNATQAVTLTYTPAALGAFNVVVTISGCGEPVTVTLTGTGVCSEVATNCPLVFGDVTVVETKTMPLVINNTGTAALNISAINFSDADFTSDAVFPLVIAAGGNATVNVTVTPSAVEGLVTETATIVSDACAGNYVCTLTVNKMTPPYVILYIDPACQVIKADVPFDIQVKIRQVTDIQPITAIRFDLCLDTCFAGFDVASITMATGKSVIDSMGWKLQYHYLEPWQLADDNTCLEIYLTGGMPLTIDGCLINLHLVPNLDCITDEGMLCGPWEEYITFENVLINEGAPDYLVEDGLLQMDVAPQWTNGIYNITRTEGYATTLDQPYVFDPACFGGGDFCFHASDADGDLMTVRFIRDDDWAALTASAYLPQPVAVTAPAVNPVQTGVVTYVAPFPCDGLSLLEWCWHWTPDKDFFATNFPADTYPRPLAFQDTIIVASSQSWPSDIVCYDTTVVNYTLEQLDAYAYWENIVSYACDDPEPMVWLCADEHYYGSITEMGLADGGIYSIDLILDYDCTCLVPYEVGFEGLITEELGALTYTINEELCLICVSMAFNEPLESEALCVPIMYVGFYPQGTQVNAICEPGYVAELSIEHVKINEAGLTVCWANGSISYDDEGVTAGGYVYYSDCQEIPGYAPVEYIVDNLGGAGVFDTPNGTWTTYPYTGAYAGGAALATNNGIAWARFLVPAATLPGTFDVYAWWPIWQGGNAATTYQVNTGGGLYTTVVVDQTVNGGQWNLIGTFAFTATAWGYGVNDAMIYVGGSNNVYNDPSGPYEIYRADAIRMVDASGVYPCLPVEGVTINVTDECGGTAIIPPLTTDEYGHYTLTQDINCDVSFCVTPSMADLLNPSTIVTAMDASLILQSLCHQITLTHNEQLAADITCDGNVTAFDAATLLRWIVGYDVDAVIGQWVIEYMGTEADDVDSVFDANGCYIGDCACYEKLLGDVTNERWDAVVRGDVSLNWLPKAVVGDPIMTLAGRKAVITLPGDVMSAGLVLNGLNATSVKAPEGMLCEWRAANGVTKIAIASADLVSDVQITVEFSGADVVELSGIVNDMVFAETKTTVPVVPTDFSLSQNYPNPFNPTTSIEFGLPENAKVTVQVFNVLGQMVTELVNGQIEAGYHRVQWDASQMASGVYFYRIDAGNYTATRSMILMK